MSMKRLQNSRKNSTIAGSMIAYSLVSDYSLQFNAGKFKCIVVLPSCRRYLTSMLDKCDFRIGDMATGILSSYTHLGHVINNNLTDAQDILARLFACFH